SLGNRLLGEWSNYTPAGCITYILRSRCLILNRLDKSIADKIVHAAVTGPFSLFLMTRPQLRVKFILIFIKFLPLMWFAAPPNVDSITIHIPQSIGTLRAESQRIRARQRGIERDDNRLLISCRNGRSDNIAGF